MYHQKKSVYRVQALVVVVVAAAAVVVVVVVVVTNVNHCVVGYP